MLQQSLGNTGHKPTEAGVKGWETLVTNQLKLTSKVGKHWSLVSNQLQLMSKVGKHWPQTK